MNDACILLVNFLYIHHTCYGKHRREKFTKKSDIVEKNENIEKL